jgi:hypothetical protein
MAPATMKTLRLSPPPGRKRRLRLPSLSLLVTTAVASFLVLWALDYAFFGKFLDPAARPTGPFALLFALDPQTLESSLAGLSQVIVAVLGIAITVVSIVVQLSATRYTSRVVDMFFRDRTNLAIMGFFVIACLHAVWMSIGVSREFVPRATIAFALVMVSTSLLLLIPYFAYVFDFLDPEKVILRLGQHALDAALGRRSFERARLESRQVATTTNLEQLADVAVNAVAQKDKVIASSAVAAKRELVVHYLGVKGRLPPEWFLLVDKTRENPDFIALAPNSLLDLERQRTWLEWKTLRHFRSVFAESLRQLPEMAHVVGIEARYIGEAALQVGDRAALGVTIKYFNTFIRTALNARDVRAAYNTLNQYRQLAEQVLRARLDDTAVEIGRYLRYYGQTAHAMDLGFVTETAAYDLSALCERAFEDKAPCHDALLRTFLDVDKEAETKSEEKALRGVRKAQVKLATFYLLVGAEAHARTIHADMRNESRERLHSIRSELEAITDKDFWEVTDRGVNFDYLDATRKQRLATFFGWFAE